MSNIKYIHPSLVPRYEESHASDDVGLWATGPMAFLFHTTHEQNYVGHVMAFSLCVGFYEHSEYCTQRRFQSLTKTYLIPFAVIVGLVLISILMFYCCVKKRMQRRGAFALT